MMINQFHSGSAEGDAVTNQMLMIRDLLREKGFESDIYAEFIPESLRNNILSIHQYKGDQDAILFIHHSMGFDGFDQIISLPDKKAIIYHNITPEHFFKDEQTRQYVRKGRWQAAEYRKHVDYAIAASNYNRQELLRMGYTQVDVMPVHISVNRFDKVIANQERLAAMAETQNILFVGRVVENKCQEDILRAFAIYHQVFQPKSRLVLVGDTSGSYGSRLLQLAETLGVRDALLLTGKITEEELKAYYQSASLFLCMSEHEGFGVPLLEAMVMKVPVMAYRSSAIPETMGGAGILLLDKQPKYVAALMSAILTDPNLTEKILQKQWERIDKLRETSTDRILFQAIENIQRGERKRTIQLQGPFETSYSLAIVNRKLMEALDDLGQDDISIYCTEGPGDYAPDPKNLADKPHAKRLWEKSRNTTYPDVVIRNMYPPRVSDANGGLNFLSFAWEEDRIPEPYVKQFNQYLTGIGTTSEFVSRTLKKSGVTIPVTTIGNGVELPNNFSSISQYPLQTKKRIKFLHISSAFPRKGVDILLRAYFAAFTDKDDVCLILKTFPNPHNQVKQLLDQLHEQHPQGPEVEWINCDLPEEKLYGLYKAADCYVHSARGEGFGLPVAEAMLARLPVIVSPNTGLADFCNEDTAALVPYTMEPAHSHLTEGTAYWAKPDESTLCQRMQEFYQEPSSMLIQNRIENAYRLISTQFTWEAAAKRWTDFIDWVAVHQVRPRVAMVTTWNNKCGIAEYTRFQCEAMCNMADFTIYPNYGVELLRPDEGYVQRRSWHSAFSGNMDELCQALLKGNEEIIHFQFNFGFFKLEELAKTIRQLYGRKRIIITFHKTKNADVNGTVVSLRSIRDALNLCWRLVVHQSEDKKILISFGINPDIIEIIPLGQIVYDKRDKEQVQNELGLKRSLVLGSYGFLLPHKGILENIKAVELIRKQYPDVLYIPCCALHDSPESKNYYDTCAQYVNKHGLAQNVVFVTDFLELEESMVLLQACDVLLMSYLPTGESASGAVRFCVAAQRPLITTQQAIFDEFRDCTMQIAEVNPGKIAEMVYTVVQQDCRDMMQRMREHVEKTNWDVVAMRVDQVYRQ